jgi:hypothetical protein
VGTSNHWKCEYPTPRHLDSGEDQRRRQMTRPIISIQNQRVAEGSGYQSGIIATGMHWGGETMFPPSFFLDADLFQQFQLAIPRGSTTIPSYIQDFLGNLGSIREVAAKYFEEIHSWMPFLARKHLCRHLLNPLSPLQTDTALLIVAMQLISLFPVDSATDPRIPMYLAAKRCYAEAEMAGAITVPYLQAAVLLLIYEYGHAIYPAAFFSVASCARCAVILAIDQEESIRKDTSLTWIEIEERRRLWWAILIMDRYVLLISPRFPILAAIPIVRQSYSQ